MARTIVVTRDGANSTFALKRLRRTALYRTRRRRVLDSHGEPTRRAELTDDGEILLQAGMTAQGYFDEAGHWVKSTELVAVDREGNLLTDKTPSTLGTPVELEEVEPEALLNIRKKAVYMLDPDEEEGLDDALLAALKDGKLFRFPFAYRPTYDQDEGYLVANDEGVFAIVGNPVAERPWSELDRLVDDLDEDEEDDELDFDFF